MITGEEEGETVRKNCVKLIFLDFIYLFSERREGREKDKERNIDVREKHQSIASPMYPNQGPNPQPMPVPDQNRTCDLSLRRMTPNHLSHTNQGKN